MTHNAAPCAVCKGSRVAYETGLFWSEAHACTACVTIADAISDLPIHVTTQSVRWPEPSPEAVKHLDALCDRIWQNEGGVTGQELYANVVNILEARPSTGLTGKAASRILGDEISEAEAVTATGQGSWASTNPEIGAPCHRRDAPELFLGRRNGKTALMASLLKGHQSRLFIQPNSSTWAILKRWFGLDENERIEATAARLGCTDEVARQIVTGKPTDAN